MKRISLVATLVLLAAFSVAGAQTVPEVTASWQPPTTGSPVVFYVFQLFEGDGPEPVHTVNVEETSYVLPDGLIQSLLSYTARVRGVDAMGRVGPWSLPSQPFIYDPGPPGACENVRMLVSD